MAAQKRKNNKQGKSPSKYLRFTSVAFQMGATIWMGNLFGKWLDATYNQDILESIMTLCAVFIAMYMVIAQVIKVSKEDD